MADVTTPDGWTDGDVEADGVRLHYYRSGGSGRPFVVSHGITNDGRSRIPLVEDLTDEYDVIAYDARGHGRSAAPDEQYTYADLADDLVGLVDALELEAPVLYGHSMGGTTVATAAAREPDLPQAVVLEDPELLGLAGDADADGDGDGADAGGEGDEAEPDPADDDFLNPIVERVRGRPAPSREALLETEPELQPLLEADRERLATLLADAFMNVDETVETLFAAERADPAAVFAAIEAPTLVLKADAAPDARERHREAAAHLPAGRLVHVDGAGHCVLRDEPDRTLELVREFLASH
ncbi:alpha/beta hydrolase [Haloterrigena salina JCM 13891]|uniref:Alpha/beta hydrolase n=1 Tax=Haloterrigena salina JCM 13891 TaxID=1227488 RepID=M0BZW3_9EURY|nr:alpha/beta hydrolase [Haloterrigena salina]ELZ15229.1 alpha/beta hydrolase [Haloterrigena salina JCM 13891]